ncbi:MAG: DHH family phosphoesterase [Candidatus Cloacimonetes bacterium]|nr:DHH family phosphoesterase [Candidatus Cloacimonadota bacterium]
MKLQLLSQFKQQLLNKLELFPRVAILTHRNPDGDGLGSALFLQEFFRQRGIRLDIVLEELPPRNLDFLNLNKRYKPYQNDLIYQLLIIVDCHEASRLGAGETMLSRAEAILILDHHEENNAVKDAVFYNDTTSSCVGGIIYRMFADEITELPSPVRKYLAEAVYVAILNDTENFQNTNTDAETFTICSELMQLGLQPGQVMETFLLNRSLAEMKYVGDVMSSACSFADDRILFIYSTREMLQRRNLDMRANSKMTRWFKGTRGVQVIVFWQEVSENLYRLSLRSPVIDVYLLARKYGGGGHRKAAGCELQGRLPDLEKLVLQDIRELLA